MPEQRDRRSLRLVWALQSDAGAAPHLPAGILSPYSDGERGALIAGFANLQRCKKGAEAAAIPLLPVTIRGEGPGRGMRGGAGFGDWSEANDLETESRPITSRLNGSGEWGE
ncbi:hypothetical protein ABID26_007115 [Mesorhizobium shonense]|uniref:Uncharacterized protein n=1 Tax=Mesorhizobium shonense TaxID=1209948 RepID=A0ABV2I4I4_9HYPH